MTIFPVALMFCSIVWYSCHSRLLEVREELAERSRVIATALAESSEYSVISGNFSDLERIANSLVQADSNIYQIDILDADKRNAIRTMSTVRRDAENRVFEVPIKKKLLSMRDFADDSAPHISGPNDFASPMVSEQVIGYVRVTMSPASLVSKQKNRFYIQLALVSCVLFASLFFSIWLARNLNKPIADAIKALRRIREGDYAVRLNVTTGGDISELQTSINEMSVSLKQSTQNLEQKVCERTRELETSRNEAIKSDAEKRRLIQKLNSVVEDERKSIAIEIHDELNAMLIAARLDAQRILNLAAQFESSPASDEIKKKAASIIELTLGLYASARKIVRRLRPEVLDMLGLHGAVEEMIRYYGMSHSHCRFEFHAVGDCSKLDNALAIAAYRLIQEGLANIVKHSAATSASVLLFLNEAERLFQITIADNGSGFDPIRSESGIGIIGMRERVYAFDGHMNVESRTGIGTVIHIRLPLISG